MPLNDGNIVVKCGFCGICYLMLYLASLVNNYWPVSSDLDSLNYYFDNIQLSYIYQLRN